MSDPAVHELEDSPRTAVPAKRGAWLFRVVVAVVVVGVAVWYLRARQERPAASPTAGGGDGSAASAGRRGDAEGRVVTVQ
ncbi:MAG TPA: hypothetical protein VIX73_33590, partial [Kofleriaceae bacterium]